MSRERGYYTADGEVLFFDETEDTFYEIGEKCCLDKIQYKENDFDSVGETEIFAQLKERDEMRELLTKIYNAQNDKTSSLANMNGLINKAKNFIK